MKAWNIPGTFLEPSPGLKASHNCFKDHCDLFKDPYNFLNDSCNPSRDCMTNENPNPNPNPICILQVW